MSDRGLRAAAIALAALGLAIAVYLTWIHYSGDKPLCVAGGGGCERVQSSSYAKLAGVPVALLGLGGYIGLLGTAIARGELARLASVAIALVGLGFSGYLTYLELFVIHAICQWCVASAVIMTLLAAVSVWRFVRADDAAAPA